MEIKNSPSFCGKIIYSPDGAGMEKSVTTEIKNIMRAAPKGTELHIGDRGDFQIGRIGFTTPASKGAYISGDVCRRDYMIPARVMKVVREGLYRMKKGVTEPWATGEVTTARLARERRQKLSVR